MKIELINGEFWTAKRLADYLQVKPNTIYAWVVRREIPFIKLPGNVTRFPTTQLSIWIDKRTSKGISLKRGVYLENA